MKDNESKYRDALVKIVKVANDAISGNSLVSNGHEQDVDERSIESDANSCVLKMLPRRLAIRAAETAVKLSPMNAPAVASVADQPVDPMQIAVMTTKYWGPFPRKLSVSFMETTPTDLRARILSHMNAWSKTACITFVETQAAGVVRISRTGSGYWSYVGTDILQVPLKLQTMNLANFTMKTPDAEFYRVIRHETGHTLGFPHEHMRKELVARIDPLKAYPWFLKTYGWNKQMVDAQVLTSLNEQSIFGTQPDQTSIMCYMLPGVITYDGKPILGGMDINKTDLAFAGLIYPKSPLWQTDEPMEQAEADWGEEEDVKEVALA